MEHEILGCRFPYGPFIKTETVIQTMSTESSQSNCRKSESRGE